MQDQEFVYSNPQDTSVLSKLDIGPWIQVIVERVWIVLSVALVIAAGGTFWAIKQEDIYRANTTIYVAPEEQKLMSMEDVARADVSTEEALNTIAQRLRQSSVFLRVVRVHALTNHPAFATPAGVPSEHQVAAKLAGLVSSKVRLKTRLIDISVEDRNQDVVSIVANGVANQFLRATVEEKLEINKSANAVLLEEADRLRNKVEASERALQDYKEKHNAASLEDQQNIILAKLTKLNGDYTAAKTARLQVETDLQQMEKLGTNVQAILELPSVLRDPTIQAMRSKVIDQEVLVATMTNKYKPKYPKMAQALNQLEDLRHSLDQLVLGARGFIQSAYEGAKSSEIALQKAVKEAEEETMILNRLGVEYNVLTRYMESDRALYQAVLKRLNETDLAKGLEKNAITITEPAVRPGGPYKPDRVMIIAASCLGGLLAGIALAMFLNFIDNSLKTVDEAEALLGVPVIGAVPLDKVALKAKHRRVVLEEPHSTCAESYRSLVAAIDMMGRLEEQRVVLFTSAVPGEGKTFSSVNYSITHAQKGRRTLLIDFDLRRPSVAETFDLPNDNPGVTDYLLGKAPLEKLCVSIPGVENLLVLTAGPRVPNPAEQIAKPWVAELIKEASSKFDRVVLDTPPLNAVADTSYLLPFAQIISLVVRTGKTPAKAVRRTLQLMQRNGTTPSGIVLNYLPERSGYGYYYYYHYYSSGGYYSKGVYGVDDDTRNGKPKKSKRRTQDRSADHRKAPEPSRPEGIAAPDRALTASRDPNATGIPNPKDTSF